MKAIIISWYIGIALLFVSALMTASGIIACFFPGDDSRIPLLLSALLTGIVGLYPLIFVRRGKYRLNFREGNFVVVGSWLAACIFGMLPFLFYGGDFGFVNALFESVSGFTTTGASILTDIESLPHGLLFWRTATAWVGGVGIVTLFSRLMVGRSDQSTLSGAEISRIAREELPGERSEFFANIMLITYISLTILTGVALRLTGIGWFDAATTAMSACSTCGFCTRNASIASFANPAAESVLTVAMLLAGINFGLVFLTFIRGGRKNVFKTEVSRAFLSLAAVSIAVVTADLLINGSYASVGRAFRDAAFQVASLVTTTGFATCDTTLWPTLSMGILIVCSLICGCSGSTSGGIKMDRILLAGKGVLQKVKSYTHPGTIYTIRVDGHQRSDAQVSDAFGFIVCYVSIMILCCLINFAGGLDFTTGLTASIASIGNVGPGFGDVGSMANYADMPTLIKSSSMVEMLIGRLEIFPVLYLFRGFR